MGEIPFCLLLQSLHIKFGAYSLRKRFKLLRQFLARCCIAILIGYIAQDVDNGQIVTHIAGCAHAFAFTVQIKDIFYIIFHILR